MNRPAGMEWPDPPEWCGHEFTPLSLQADAETELRMAAQSALYLIDAWPRVREHLEWASRSLGGDPICVGQTPVLSAPLVRLLCGIVAQHCRLKVPVDRFEATAREKAVLMSAAAGETSGSLLDWPILGGILYRIADELNVGGVPHAGNFHRTAAEGGAFRLLCRLLLEHIDVEG